MKKFLIFLIAVIPYYAMAQVPIKIVKATDSILVKQGQRGISTVKIYSSNKGNGIFVVTDSVGNKRFEIDSLGRVTTLTTIIDTLKFNNATPTTINGTISFLNQQSNVATDGTAFYNFTTTGVSSPDASAEVSVGKFQYNWEKGDNQTFTANAIEGVARSRGTDEASTLRGGLFRTYTDNGGYANATARTSVGVEASVRTAANNAAESGTAFIGSRIWMAPYFTAGTVGNVNNFWGLWIYGEHTTQRNADAAIKISTAGGGFTDDIILQNGEGITNVPDGTITIKSDTLGVKSSRKAGNALNQIKLFSSFNGNGILTVSDSVNGDILLIDSLRNFTPIRGIYYTTTLADTSGANADIDSSSTIALTGFVGTLPGNYIVHITPTSITVGNLYVVKRTDSFCIKSSGDETARVTFDYTIQRIKR